MVEKERSDFYVVFTMILCDLNFGLVSYESNINSQATSSNIYLCFKTYISSATNIIKLLLLIV